MMSSPLLKLEGLRNKLTMLIEYCCFGAHRGGPQAEGATGEWKGATSLPDAADSEARYHLGLTPWTFNLLWRYINYINVPGEGGMFCVSGNIRQTRCMKLKLSSILIVWGGSRGFERSSPRLCTFRRSAAHLVTAVRVTHVLSLCSGYGKKKCLPAFMKWIKLKWTQQQPVMNGHNLSAQKGGNNVMGLDADGY